jgi:aminopeptidase N
MIRIAGLCVCVSLTLVASARAADEPLRTTADRRIDVRHIRLEVSLDLEAQSLEGTAQIEFTVLQPARQVLLDAVDHDVAGIWQVPEQGKPVELEFENTGRQLQIDMGRQLERGDKYRLRIAYAVTEPQSGMHFFRPSDAEPDVPWMAWTQGEPRHNHYWFPCVDHPSERQSTEILASVDQRYRVLSNGKLIERKPVDGDRVRYHWLQEKPHVAYLVTLVVGEFAVVEEQWRGRPVTYYAPPDHEADIAATFGRTIEMLDFFSETFGIEYPWDQYAQVVVEQFTSGGMENTSATTLYDGVMHDKRALLDSTPDRLIAHELGHQWWGDLVTCKDWAHLWLNEGFATYCEVLWWEHALGKDEADYLLWQKSGSARSGSTRERPIVDRFYPAPWTMFDNRAYPKAGWVLHMLRNRVGDEDFFRALQRYGTAYSFQTAETSDLRKTFSELTGLSLERFFYDWTERAGHPVLSVATSWQPEDKLVKLLIKQEQKEEPFAFPLTVELVADDTAQSVTLERDIDERELTVYVPMPDRPVLVRVDPGLTLLAEVKETKSDDLWKQQLAAAPSVVERIRAVQHYGESKKAADRKLLATTLNEDDFYGVRVAAATALGRSGGEFSREALIEGLQAEHPKVRRSCAEALAKFDDDDKAAEALRAALQADEASYHVRAEVIQSLSKIAPEMDVATLAPLLETPSHREVVRQAVLTAIGRSEDAAAIATLSDWTMKGRERNCRIAAMKALANFLIRQEVPVARQTECVELLSGYLTSEGPHQRRAAAEALGALGRIGEPALSPLSAIAEHDPDQRVRSAAETAIKAIRDREGDGKEVQRLRDELDDLRELNETLEDRLLKLESR